jgi:hypothetical protein
MQVGQVNNSGVANQPDVGTGLKSFAQAQQYNVQVALAKDKVKVEPHSYTCNQQAAGIVFPNGKRAQFIPNGKGMNVYTTDKQSEIDYLDAEIAYGHPHLGNYVGEPILVIEGVEALKARFFAEFQAEQAKALDGTKDAGTSLQGKLNVANSNTVKQGAAGSDSAGATK